MASNTTTTKANGRHWVFDTLPLIYDDDCDVLILGTIPGAKSRAKGAYYADPNNKFWKVIDSNLSPMPHNTIDEQREYLLANHIALWDVCFACNMIGSANSTIRDIIPNHLCALLKHSNIKYVLFNGKEAEDMFGVLKCRPCCCNNKSKAVKFITLPSTSGANNANWNKLEGDAQWAAALKNRRP